MAFLNGYRDGYDSGYDAGKTGKSADPVKSKGFGRIVSQALKPQNYTATFLDGWKEGYRKGAEARNRNR